MQGIADVGLDPIPDRLLQLRRGRDFAPDPGRGQILIQPEAGRSGLVDDRRRRSVNTAASHHTDGKTRQGTSCSVTHEHG